MMKTHNLVVNRVVQILSFNLFKRRDATRVYYICNCYYPPHELGNERGGAFGKVHHNSRIGRRACRLGVGMEGSIFLLHRRGSST